MMNYYKATHVILVSMLVCWQGKSNAVVALRYKFHFLPIKTKFRQYRYAGNLALCYSHRSWHVVEQAPTTDMALITEYLRTWKFKLEFGLDYNHTIPSEQPGIQAPTFCISEWDFHFLITDSPRS